MGYAGLIAGLGNPGAGYARTRHNVGFMVVEQLLDLAEKAKERVSRGRETKGLHRVWTWTPDWSTHPWLVSEPLTFMNRSGQSLAWLCKKHGLRADQVIVVHDELDLALGTIRFKYGGGLAGHNGLRSIAQCLGSRDFFRLRMGIGRPDSGQDVVRYVLSAFGPEERLELEPVLLRAAQGLRAFAEQGLQAAMNSFH